MDWKVTLVLAATNAITVVLTCVIRLICTWIRGNHQRRTLQDVLRDAPAGMALIDIELTEPNGSSAVVRVRVQPAPEDETA